MIMQEGNITPEIEDYTRITAKELALIVQQMRHNQKRCKRNPTPEKLATLEIWEKKVDDIIALLTDTQLTIWL